MSIQKVCFSWGIVFILLFCAYLKRKKIRLLPSVLLTGCVTAFSLFAPMGKVLVTWHQFRITQGALLQGLYKSALLVGMVFLSQTIVSYKIQIPGKAGAFLHTVFLYFEKLTAQPLSLKKGHFIAQIDKNLNDVWQSISVAEEPSHPLP